jgi:acetyl esterase/lipase
MGARSRSWFVGRQLAQLALTGNALQPPRAALAGMPAFVAGWLTSELAPHLLALTVADAAVHAARHGLRTRADVGASLLAATNAAGYATLIRAGLQAEGVLERALVDELGTGYREVILRAPMPDDVSAPFSALALPFRMRNVDVARVRRLPYAPGGRRFQLDVFHHRDRPAGAPVLLQVHGGAWMVGNKDQQGIPLMLHMAARGWVGVSINYPLSPRSRWPEHVVAVKRALQWIRTHGAEYGADPSFVAVTGGSAGGHLAAMAGLTANDPSLQPGFEEVDTSVQACAPHYGVYDFTAESGTRSAEQRLAALLRRYVMSAEARYPEDYRAASPLYRVSADAPPFLVVHGSNDTLVPVGEARAFATRLREVAKNPVVYAELPGAQHAFDVFPSFRSTGVLRGVARFLEWCHATRESRSRVA